MRDNEKENNQPEAEVKPLILGCLLGSLTAYLVCHLFGRSPSSATWGTPTIGFVSHLTKPETTSKLQSEIDTLPCASSSAKYTIPGWRKGTSREGQMKIRPHFGT
ncbi:hypothetical protein ACFX15_038156 [Malus domestica]